MEKKTIVDQIIQHKKQPNLRYQLKERAEVFTNLLFYTLFDIDTPVEQNLDNLEKEGVTIIDKIEEFEYGKFGWIVDIEGNKIELWEPIDSAFL